VREVMGQYHWRMVMGPKVLTAGEEKEKAAKPGSDFTDCKKFCPVMIVVQACKIPDCKFEMGSPENESDRSDDEGPQHEVTIAKPFAVSKYEVTFAEWDACVDAGTCPRVLATWGREQMPVINVSWNEAKQYVGWLSRFTGKEYRLLTEAEWEYAARAGTQTRYSWGDDPGKGNANCGERRQLGNSSRMRSAYTTCTAMFSSGLRMSGTTTTTVRQRTERPGSKAAIPRPVLCAAVPGSSVLRISARPPASGSPPAAGSTSSASGLGGRLPLNSLQLYIFTSWVQGEALDPTESRGERSRRHDVSRPAARLSLPALLARASSSRSRSRQTLLRTTHDDTRAFRHVGRHRHLSTTGTCPQRMRQRHRCLRAVAPGIRQDRRFHHRFAHTKKRAGDAVERHCGFP
jgi:hypothetical protein